MKQVWQKESNFTTKGKLIYKPKAYKRVIKWAKYTKIHLEALKWLENMWRPLVSQMKAKNSYL